MSTLERVVEDLRDLPEEALEKVASLVNALRVTHQDSNLREALELYARDEATLGQAAAIAEMHQTAFLRELGRHRIPIHYGVEEFRQDLQMLADLEKQ